MIMKITNPKGYKCIYVYTHVYTFFIFVVATHPYEFDYPSKKFAEISKEDEENWNSDNSINDCDNATTYCTRTYVTIS